MLFNPTHEDRLGCLADELRLAQVVTPNLVSQIVAEACVRLPTLTKAGKAARLEHLVEAGAWTDAAFALIELELPAWKVRRLVNEDGEWFCSLSRQPNLPAALDDTADASHDVLPLAILSAFVEARARTGGVPRARAQAVPQVQPISGYAVSCENFG